jgi:3-dehydroquinate synthase
MNVHVQLGERSYDIALHSGNWSGLGAFARQRNGGSRCLVVTDSNVEPLAHRLSGSLRCEGYQVEMATVQAGEASKSLEQVSRLYDVLANLLADRKTLVVAIGGGVIGDLGGFVASTFNRGLAWICVPTTLLAMVDSSVGGKVGINHPRGKNLIGAFHQPLGVWIDTNVLEGLPDREYRSGLAEVVKYGVILDADFFSRLESQAGPIVNRLPELVLEIVARSCQLKADVVEKDERELTGLRAVLNYGHTFAHAFETVSGYGHWLHGEAVAAGMICASDLAERLGRIPPDVTARQRALLARFQLPVKPMRWPIDQLIAVMKSDKKSVAGKLRFVLPSRLGHVELVDGVDEKLVREVLSD